jgi:hypothetical protein
MILIPHCLSPGGFIPRPGGDQFQFEALQSHTQDLPSKIKGIVFYKVNRMWGEIQQDNPLSS